MDEQHEVVEILRQIREEAKQTNARVGDLADRIDQHVGGLSERIDQTNTRVGELSERIDQTNTRVGELSNRIDQTNTRVADLSNHLKIYVDRLDETSHRQIEGELRLSTEIISLADVTRQVRDFLISRLEDHDIVLQHEERIRELEKRIGDRSPD